MLSVPFCIGTVKNNEYLIILNLVYAVVLILKLEHRQEARYFQVTTELKGLVCGKNTMDEKKKCRKLDLSSYSSQLVGSLNEFN